MEDRIEQRITIRATQDKVWQLVTRPGWWLPGSRVEPARGPGRVAVAYSGDARPYVIDIVRVEPPGYASFRWSSAFGGAEPAPGNATLVEFYLRPVGAELGVTVVESGFTSLDLPEALREDEWKGNRGGWQYELAGLRTRAEASLLSPGGDPPYPPDVRPRGPDRKNRDRIRAAWTDKSRGEPPGGRPRTPRQEPRGTSLLQAKAAG